MTYTNPDNTLYQSAWIPTTLLTVAGGIIMTIAAFMYFVVFFGTMFSKKTTEAALELPVSTAYHDEKRIPFFDSFKPWVVIMIIIVLIAYVPAIWQVMENSGPDAPAFAPNNPMPRK